LAVIFCVWTATGGRPTWLAVFAAFRSTTAWPSHVKIFRARASERTERASARLRYQENRCSTSAGAIRTCTQPETFNETSHGATENIHLTHCTQSPPSQLSASASAAGAQFRNHRFIQFTDASSVEWSMLPSGEAQRVIKMYGETYSKRSVGKRGIR
jgi:hypothetical protein